MAKTSKSWVKILLVVPSIMIALSMLRPKTLFQSFKDPTDVCKQEGAILLPQPGDDQFDLNKVYDIQIT